MRRPHGRAFSGAIEVFRRARAYLTKQPRAHGETRPAAMLVGIFTSGLLGGCFWVAGSSPPAAPPASTGPAPVSVAAPQPIDVRTTRRALTPLEASDYLGDAACAECHRDAARDHAGTRHRHTLRPVSLEQDSAKFRNGNLVQDRRRRLSYRAVIDRGRPAVHATDGASSGTISPDYVIGSGRNAMTFLAEQDPNHYMKLRVSYYTRAKEWDFTPTLRPEDPTTAPAGKLEQGRDLETCILCHVTVLRKGAGGLSLATSDQGIGCERCHGPGRPHVEQLRRFKRDPHIERLGRATPERINTLCGFCHRTSENASMAEAHVARNLPRFQGLALEQSACFQKSGRLSCVTCHDPHRDSEPNSASYDPTCRGCHDNKPHEKACPVNSRSGCTGCHMPTQRIDSIPHVTYRNHWIKVWR